MNRAGKALVATAALVGLTALPAAASVGSTPRACAQPNGRVNAVVVSGGTAYVGGAFTSVTDRNGRSNARDRLAAIDTATCDLLSWSPGANGEVLSLVVSGTTVYAGGSFTSVGGQTRPRLAGVSASTGAVTAFSPAPDRPVLALAAGAGRLYAGGEFTSVGGSSRSYLAAFSLSSGALDGSWRPAAKGKVYALAMSPGSDSVYVGGNFTALAGDGSLAYLGRVDAASGATDRGFLPKPGWPVLAVTADTRGVYVGGGGAGGHLAVWNADGSLQRPVYQTDGGVQAVAVDGDSLYAGGHFTNYCIGNTGSGKPYNCDKPLSRRKVFEVSLSSGALTSWAPKLNSAHGVFTAAVDPASHDLWLGGDFTKVNGKATSRLAVFP